MPEIFRSASPRRRSAVGIAALAVLGFAWWGLRWSPDWVWVSQVLPGRFLRDPADPALVVWTGIWSQQRLESAESTLNSEFWAFLRGERVVRGQLTGTEFSAEARIRRPFGSPAEHEVPFLEASVSATGIASKPFPLLRQVWVSGAWNLEAEGSRLEDQVAHWELDWEFRNVQMEFGPDDREEFLGRLELSRVEARAERDGLTLDLVEFNAVGEGIEILGDGVIQVRPDPLESVLSLSFEVIRDLGSPALSARGWEEAIAGTSEMVIAVRGTVGEPVFYLNGFPLVEEMLRSSAPVSAPTVTEYIVKTAAAYLTVERSETGASAVAVEEAGEPDGPEPHAGYSESDIRKMQALLNRRVMEERTRKVEGHTPDYRKRWKALKQAYKDELKKMKAQGVDVRKEFGRKPNRQMREVITRQLDEEFPDEAQAHAPEEEGNR